MSDYLLEAHKEGKRLADHYKSCSIAGGGLCSFSVLNSLGKHSTRLSGVCHAMLSHHGVPPNQITYVVDAVYKNKNNGKGEVPSLIHKNFIKMHIDHPLYKETFIDTDVDEIYERGYTIHNTDIDARVLGNCLISLRMAYERPELVKTWWDLKEHGIPELYAYYLSYFYKHKNGYIEYKVPDSAHIGLDVEHLSKPFIKNFILGKTVGNCLKFNLGGNYRGTSRMWGSDLKEAHYVKLIMDIPKIFSKEDEKEYPYLFYKPPVNIVRKVTKIKLTKDVIDFFIADYNNIMEGK